MLNRLLSIFGRGKPEQIDPPRRNFGYSGGTFVEEDKALEVSAFYSGVIYLSTQVAKLPWRVKDQNKKTIPNNIDYLINVSPNPEMHSFSLKLFLLQCAVINGNGYCEIERTIDGRVKSLWPLNPKKVDPKRLADGTFVYEIMEGGSRGENVYLSPNNIFHIKNFYTKDAMTGQGVISYALNTLGTSLGADRFANNLYSNGGLPSGVLTHPGRLSKEASERILASWKENHGGKKTGGTALLEEGVTYSPISHSPDVLQFLQTRKFSVLEIARFLRIPPTKLFDSEFAKFNNIEHSNLEVATDVLDAWTKSFESEADFKLLSGQRGGMHTEFDIYAVFRGDMNTRSQYFTRMMTMGALTPNQIRLKEGLEPYEGGDRYYIATNNFSPIDRLDEIVDSNISKGSNSSSTAPIKDEEDDDEEKKDSNNDDSESELNSALAEWIRQKTED